MKSKQIELKSSEPVSHSEPHPHWARARDSAPGTPQTSYPTSASRIGITLYMYMHVSRFCNFQMLLYRRGPLKTKAISSDLYTDELRTYDEIAPHLPHAALKWSNSSTPPATHYPPPPSPIMLSMSPYRAIWPKCYFNAFGPSEKVCYKSGLKMVWAFPKGML